MDRGKAEVEQLLIQSGLFFIDGNNRPAGIFSLNRGNGCQPFKTRSRLLPRLSDLAVRVMVRKLRDVVYKYEHDKPDYLASHRELLDEIEVGLLRFLEDHNLKAQRLEPEYSKFKKKLAKLYNKQIEEDWGPRRALGKSRDKFHRLVLPIIKILKKYLENLETKQSEVPTDLVLHYTAHILIACGIEKEAKNRGHLPVYEKIKRFCYRNKFEI